jgi:hypothetical protein
MNPSSRIAIESLEDRRLLSASLVSNAALTTTPAVGTIVPISSTPVGVTIHAEATDRFNGTVGVLKNFALPPMPAAGPAAVGLQEIISWGDGSAPSAGHLVPSTSVARQFNVVGSHTYAKAGTYKVTVNIVWGPLPGSKLMTPSMILATIQSTAVVVKDDDGGVTLTEVAGQAFKAKVGSFDFRNVDLILSATIDWGDGTHSVGTITGNFATGEYNVIGSHTYAKTGQFSVHVKVLSRLAGSPSATPTGIVAQWVSTIKVLGSA